MSFRDALWVVLDLARENALECDLTDENEALEAQAEKQQEAICKMEEVLDKIDESKETVIAYRITREVLFDLKAES